MSNWKQNYDIDFICFALHKSQMHKYIAIVRVHQSLGVSEREEERER